MGALTLRTPKKKEGKDGQEKGREGKKREEMTRLRKWQERAGKGREGSLDILT